MEWRVINYSVSPTEIHFPTRIGFAKGACCSFLLPSYVLCTTYNYKNTILPLSPYAYAQLNLSPPFLQRHLDLVWT